MTIEPLYTIREVAARLHVHQETLKRWIKKGAVPIVRVGPSQLIRIPESTVQDLIASVSSAAIDRN